MSLPDDKERRDCCAAELAGLGLPFAFVDAVQGRHIPDADFARLYDEGLNRRAFKRPLSRNEVACYLGHRKIWRDIAEGDQDVCLVLEDDACFVQDPRPFLDAVAQNADLFLDVMIKLEGVARKNTTVLRPFADQTLVLSDHLPPRTTGYIIGRRAAAKLAGRDGPIGRPVDIDLKFYWEHEIPILTLQEQLVSERPSGGSQIETSRNKTKPGSGLQRFLRNLLFQARFTQGRKRHPLQPGMIKELAPLLRGDTATREHP
ncbi:glycosyltransferase family 25 protein [Ruegeria sp.]|uniref:glycosyltransferase family 25 protein n=1 Tax=Ruegeria sp. TaxID=1879320 RepID=UPI002320296B|nr:glycosyltransferase family 25 protein [Ruegeria sp.]